jgi:hypothetical protein
MIFVPAPENSGSGAGSCGSLRAGGPVRGVQQQRRPDVAAESPVSATTPTTCCRQGSSAGTTLLLKSGFYSNAGTTLLSFMALTLVSLHIVDRSKASLGPRGGALACGRGLVRAATRTAAGRSFGQ